MTKYRVKVPGCDWSNWADWNTTPSAELRAQSQQRRIK